MIGKVKCLQGANAMKSTNQFLHDFWQAMKELFTGPTADETTEATPSYSMPQFDEGDTVWIIMDDDPSLRLVVSTLFRMWGRIPLVFEDGYQGMQWVEDFREGRYDGPIPELIITNLRQPGPQGHEVCEAMRQIPELDEMAIVIWSAWRRTPEEERRIRAITDHFMPKPLPPLDDAKAIIDEAIEERRRKVRGQVREGEVP
jgi:CheY-like chemotaxis protein